MGCPSPGTGEVRSVGGRAGWLTTTASDVLSMGLLLGLATMFVP